MLLKIHPDNPQKRQIDRVVECLRNGGVIIYPTDTIYGIGCDIMSKKAIERVCQLKGISPEKANLSCVCEDLTALGEYAAPVDTPLFKLLKRIFPGPYTVILKASKKIPRHFQSKKKTVGLRIIDNNIVLEIVRQLGNPILTTSLNSDDKILEYDTDPDLIFEKYRKQVDLVIDGGYGNNVPSTVIDCSEGIGELKILREGLGPIDELE